jgi:hypothetical protein
MKENEKLKGSCLCKAVSIEATPVDNSVGACHCDMCRRWSGGPLLVMDCGTGNISFAGEQNVKIYNSSDWAERGFCSTCGTHLFYRLKKQNQYMVPVGLFDSQLVSELPNLEFDHQIFIEEKPGYYDFANETTNMTGEEVFKMFEDGQ